MTKEFVVIGTKIPKELAKKFAKIAEDEGKKPSRLLRNIIESKTSENSEKEVITCYKCDKEIKENELHFTNALSVMKYFRKDNKEIDFDNLKTVDAHMKEILCEKCAKSRKDLKKFKLKWK